jgi:hypothetical protein
MDDRSFLEFEFFGLKFDKIPDLTLKLRWKNDFSRLLKSLLLAAQAYAFHPRRFLFGIENGTQVVP